MASLARLKQEIQFNGRLAGLLDALKSIAAQQFQVLERTFRCNPTFFEAIELIAGTFNLEQLAHPFTQTSGSVGVIAVTSDTGLLGGLNQQVILAALAAYRQEPGELMVIGERGLSYAREAGVRCHPFPGVVDQDHYALAAQVRDYALNEVLAGRLHRLWLCYPRALSFTMQRIEAVPVVPCLAWFGGENTVPRGLRHGPLIMESAVTDVLEYLVWLRLGQQLVDAFGQSRLSELAARSVHLEGSSQELQRRGRKLWLRYFRERHEVIDRNMRELFTARSLFANTEELNEGYEKVEV